MRKMEPKPKKKNLPIKTFTGYSSEEMDEKVNAFKKENVVEYTQTHVEVMDGRPFYCYVVFYYPKSLDEDPRMPCPKCGKHILKVFSMHEECGWTKNANSTQPIE